MAPNADPKYSRFSPRYMTAFRRWTMYVLKWLEIDQWDIKLLEIPPPQDNVAAMITCVYARTHADLQLADNFFDHSQRDQELYLIHEFTHILFNPVDKIVADGNLEKALGEPSFLLFEGAFLFNLESAVDHVARVLYDLLCEQAEFTKLCHQLYRAQL